MVAPRRLQTIFSPLVIVGSASFVAGIAAMYLFAVLQHQSRSAYVAVEEKTIIETVQGTGTLQPSGDVTLGFSRGGTISRMAVDTGSRVMSHQRLAALGAPDLSAELSAAKSDAAAATSKVKQLSAATTSAAIASARSSVADAIAASLTTSDAAVQSTGQFIRSGSPPQLLIDTSNAAAEQPLLSEHADIEQLLASWHASSTVATSTDLSAAAAATADNLTSVEGFLNHAATLLSYAMPSTGYSASDLNVMRGSIVEARLSIADTLTALTAAASKLSMAESASGPQALATAEAAAATATARVKTLQGALQATELIAPIAGTIGKRRASLGDTVKAGEPVFTLSSSARVQMSAQVSAAEAGGIHIGDAATVQLDRASGVTIPAQVVSVGPAAEKSTMYTVVAQLTDDSVAAAIGAQGTLNIVIGSSSDALVVPQSALVTKGGQTFVLKAGAGGHDDLVPVETGILSDTGEVEILSGLSAGDKVRSTISVY